MCLPQDRGGCRSRCDLNDVGPRRDDFFCTSLHLIQVHAAPAQIDLQILAALPPEPRESFKECLDPALALRISLGETDQHAEPPPAARLLRERCERPAQCRAAQSSYESSPCDPGRHRNLSAVVTRSGSFQVIARLKIGTC